MPTNELIRRPRLSRRASHEMVLLFAKAGNHNKPEKFTTDAEVKRAFAANGLNFERVVEDCRDPKVGVPFFENLLGSTWTLQGVSLSQFDPVTGEQITKAEGPGTYTPFAYWAAYELAHEALERAISGMSYREFLAAFVHGVSAIESFIATQVHKWNQTHPDNMLIDSKAAKISFDDKIDKWIPLMIGGKKLDKSGHRWQAFKRLQSIRDDVAIHRVFPVRVPDLSVVR